MHEFVQFTNLRLETITKQQNRIDYKLLFGNKKLERFYFCAIYFCQNLIYLITEQNSFVRIKLESIDSRNARSTQKLFFDQKIAEKLFRNDIQEYIGGFIANFSKNVMNEKL